jgi:NADPH2:quinone reductase
MPKAILVEKTGGPEVLSLVDRDPGAPGAGQLRVRVAAAGVNFIDVYFRTGLYPRPLPFVVGLEGAGRVEAVGPDVVDISPGDRVAWASAPGSYAESALVPAGAAVRVPEAVSDELAAAAMLQGMTAHYLVHAIRPPAPGNWALVHAAAGGTGLLLVQMLRAAGMHVIGTCGSAEKAALVRDAGADGVVRYDTDDFVAAARAATNGRGVHFVFDGVGRATFDGSLASLRPRGLLALFGQSSGPVPPFDLQRLNAGGSLLVTRPSLAHFVATRAELEERAGAVLGAVAAGQLSIRIGARFPLAQAPDAHRALEARETTGKLLLIP